MDLADVLILVLADEDRALRAKCPEIFCRSDAVKATPGWRSFRSAVLVEHSFKGLRWAECPWCGDNFVAERGGVCCSCGCSNAYRHWKTVRAKRQRGG